MLVLVLGPLKHVVALRAVVLVVVVRGPLTRVAMGAGLGLGIHGPCSRINRRDT